MYVLTAKGDISSPIIRSFYSRDAAYSFDFKCTDGSVISISVYDRSDVPPGFEDRVQAVPVAEFKAAVRKQIVKERP